jgi:anti-sigma regulatory factor (Ser/Thr protein kinase)
MSPETPILTLSFPSDLAWLAVARTFIENVCQAGGFNAADTRAIVLASNEAISNVMRHAHDGHPEKRMQIECRLDDASMEIRLADEGGPFDINQVPHLDPADMRLGGRGVYLMRVLMDELSCEPSGERGNVLRMLKKRTGP